MRRNLVVIGGSAGCIEVLSRLLPALSENFSAAICLVVHTHPKAPGALADILQRECRLPVRYAEDGEICSPGHIYVAPPDHHILLRGSRLAVNRGPRENRARPAIDPLFRSAARAYGRQVIAVLLTGALDDGTLGLKAVKDRGGIAVVQDPVDAPFPNMVESALKHVTVDYCLPLPEIPPLLTKLTEEDIEPLEDKPVSANTDNIASLQTRPWVGR
jgi:two-component system, chemotaxis family, protein-glutamate methylesterase/glutaminase